MSKQDLPFIVNFLGQLVLITTTTSNSSTAMTPEGPIVENWPISFKGILIDSDDEYYYLGEKMNEISRMVSKKEFLSMEVVEEEDPLDQILKDFPTPEGSEIN